MIQLLRETFAQKLFLLDIQDNPIIACGKLFRWDVFKVYRHIQFGPACLLCVLLHRPSPLRLGLVVFFPFQARRVSTTRSVLKHNQLN